MNVHSWLLNPKRSYADGVELLKSLKPKDAMFFASVQNPSPDSYHFRFLVSKLQNESRKMAQQPAKIQEVSNIRIIDVPTKPATGSKTDKELSARFADHPLIDVRELPENLQSDFQTIKGLSREIARLHTMLKAATTDDERKSLLESLKESEAKQKELWASLDKWQADRKLPVVEPEKVNEKKIAEQALARARRIDTLKINISRATRELEKVTGKKAESRKEKIAAWEVELKGLENEQ